MTDLKSLPWDIYLYTLGPQPVTFSIVTRSKVGYGNTTREPAAAERGHILAWLGLFVTKNNMTPLGDHTIGGVEEPVVFRRIWQ